MTRLPLKIRARPKKRRAVRRRPSRRSDARYIPASRRKNKTRRQSSSRSLQGAWLWGVVALILAISACGAITLGGAVVFVAGRVPPNVSAMGVSLGWQTEAQAMNALQAAAGQIALADGARTWRVSAAELGVTVDAAATTEQAMRVGFGQVFTPVQVMPVVRVDSIALTTTLQGLRSQVTLPARDAGFTLEGGAVRPVPAEYGRALDVQATVDSLMANPGAVLRDGRLELVMQSVAPDVLDASPLVSQAERLLASPLRINAYDPIADTSTTWRLEPVEWAGWLTVRDGSLSARTDEVADYLRGQSGALADYQRIDADAAAEDIAAAVADFNPNPTVRVYQTERTHTVRSGESITSIAWDYGIPYPYIQQANPGVDTLNAGMSLTIPSPDVFLEYPVVYNKRVVVSMSGGWTRVYEDGALKWDWASSTGIDSSPTWPGVYQIVSHERNAYAGNWNLHMPWFMGVYRPVPGSDFTNGFHGFPTRGGGQLLWQNSLGRKVTYGCILLSDTNAQRLYEWAEEGVIVEIVP